MKKNEGNLDRGFRIVLGLALIGAAVAGPAAPWGYIGIVPVLTGALGWCPLYTVFGFSTCPMKKNG